MGCIYIYIFIFLSSMHVYKQSKTKMLMLTMIMDIMLLFCRWCRTCYHFVILTIKRKWSNHISAGHVTCIVKISVCVRKDPTLTSSSAQSYLSIWKIIIHISLNGVTVKAGKTRSNTLKWMKSVTCSPASWSSWRWVSVSLLSLYCNLSWAHQ